MEALKLQVKKNGKAKIDQLTSLRFFAAFMIVMHHSQNLLGIENGFNLGQGVSFFFILSGFILAYVYPSLDTRPSVLLFLRARIARVWPVYIFSLLFAFFVIPFSWRNDTGLANVLMLQAWLPMSTYYFSYNAAAWSISTEFFFYLAFSVLIHNWHRTWPLKFLLSLATLVALIFLCSIFDLPAYADPSKGHDGLMVTQHGLIYINPISRIFEFVVGMVVATIWKKARKPQGPVFGTMLEVLAIILCVASVYMGGSVAAYVGNSVFGPSTGQWFIHSGSVLAFAILIYVIATGAGLVSKVLNLRIFVFLGEISFSLYLFHQTLLTVTERWGLHRSRPFGWHGWCFLRGQLFYRAFHGFL